MRRLTRAEVHDLFPTGEFRVFVRSAETGEVLTEFVGRFEDCFVSGSAPLVLATDLPEAFKLDEEFSGPVTVRMATRDMDWVLETPPCSAKLIDRWSWYGPPEEGGSDHEPEPVLVAGDFWWPLANDGLLDEVLA